MRIFNLLNMGIECFIIVLFKYHSVKFSNETIENDSMDLNVFNKEIQLMNYDFSSLY